METAFDLNRSRLLRRRLALKFALKRAKLLKSQSDDVVDEFEEPP